MSPGTPTNVLPADADLAALPGMTIWCARFSVFFTAASLESVATGTRTDLGGYGASVLVEDPELLARLRAGDQVAFAATVRAWSPAMLRVARLHVRSHAVAEEVVQEAWLAVVRALDGFEGRASCAGECSASLSATRSAAVGRRPAVPTSSPGRRSTRTASAASTTPGRATGPEAALLASEFRGVLERGSGRVARASACCRRAARRTRPGSPTYTTVAPSSSATMPARVRPPPTREPSRRCGRGTTGASVGHAVRVMYSHGSWCAEQRRTGYRDAGARPASGRTAWTSGR